MGHYNSGTQTRGEEFSRLHTNQRLLCQALRQRGAGVEILVGEREIVEVEVGSRREVFIDRAGSALSYCAAQICADKYLTKQFLRRAGLVVPRGELFFPDQRVDALRYAAALETAIVVKPNRGSHGIGCRTELWDSSDVADAFDDVVVQADPTSGILIEEQCEGDEYRLFVTRRGDWAVVRRDPASVIGDGRRSIQELVEAENEVRRQRLNPALSPLVQDNEVSRFLHLQGLSWETVPGHSEVVPLRRNSNVALGGVPVDVTDEVDERYVAMAMKILQQIPGLPYVGIDIIADSISDWAGGKYYSILELNSNPSFKIHEFPGHGMARPVSGYVVDALFPELSLDRTKAG